MPTEFDDKMLTLNFRSEQSDRISIATPNPLT